MYEQLEIIRLGQQGEQKRRISCLVGRVSVFRSTLESDLQQYINALLGHETGDRFSILLDGNTFIPAEHHFIGFGEAFEAESNATVGEYLADAGYTPDEVEQTALTNGLGGLSRARVAELSSGQSRILRILAATGKNDHIVVMNEPFDDVPDTWREALAERIVRFAWKHKAIVLITRLSYRPECWVENEFITRIPLQRPRQHTIGMGGGEFSSPSVVAELREQLNKPGPSVSVLEAASQSRERAQETLRKKLELRSGTHLTAVPSKPDGFKFGKAMTLLGAVAACLAITIVTIVQSGKDSRVTPVIQPADPKPTTSTDLTPLGSTKTSGNPLPINSQLSGGTLTKAPLTALDEYPEPIRRAVIQAANEPDLLLKQMAATTKLRVSPRLIEDKPLPVPVMQPTDSATVEDSPPLGHSMDDTQGELTEEEIQERREEIRRKFLEAIQRQAGFGG